MIQEAVAKAVNQSVETAVNAAIPPAIDIAIKSNMHTMVEKALEPIHGKIDNLTEQLNLQLTETKEQTTENKKQIEKLASVVNNLEDKSEEHEQKIAALEETVTKLEIDKASYILRLQNLEEQEGEDVQQNVIKLLAEYIQEEDEIKVKNDIEAIYHVNTTYTRKNKLPPEVHIRFAKKSLRQQILTTAMQRPLMRHKKEIKILRDVPWRKREKRKLYKKLVNPIRKKGIKFKWLTPEGITFNYKERWHKINSVFKLEEFIRRFGEELEIPITEESQSQGEEEEEEEEEEGPEKQEGRDGKRTQEAKQEKRPKRTSMIPLQVRTRLFYRKKKSNR
ncbi:PREDICTED: apolipoprotein A-IV-like [Gekko japonicus]|uniref:Apolipoprotein A-IV-like n=1 Tax=Gekko japonicus TaxID=146911 RepID=A0ABM1KSX6_GEKJA|nr:PREDICTED: apolipoprotein A-IV-like [Gekko japonicus]